MLNLSSLSNLNSLGGNSGSLTQPSLTLPLKTSLVPTKGSNPTFTRAATATVKVYDEADSLLKRAKAGEARFEGARRVENGIATRSADASGGGGWAYSGTSVAVGGAVTWSAGSYISNVTTIPAKANQVVVLSFTASSATATTLIVRVDRSGIAQGNQQTYTISSIPKRYSFKATLNSNTTAAPVARFDYGNGNVVITDFQIEDVTGQANQNPSEYVSIGVVSAPLYHGLGVDGVKDFTTLNGNTVDVNNVVIEATGTAISEATLKGINIEPPSTNLYLNSETLSTQNNTTTAQIYTISFYGTGSITLSGTATGILTGTGVNDRVSITFTATAGTLTSTISGSVKKAQLEALPYTTSYIQTTTASVTRDGEVPTAPISNLSKTQGTISFEFTPYRDIPVNTTVGDGRFWFVQAQTNTLIFNLQYYNGTLQLASSASYPITFLKGVTYEIAVKWGTFGGQVFVNGVAGPIGVYNSNFNFLNNYFTIGGQAGTTTGNMTGSIKNFNVYKKVLGDTKIVTLTTIYIMDENGDFAVDENGDFAMWQQ